MAQGNTSLTATTCHLLHTIRIDILAVGWCLVTIRHRVNVLSHTIYVVNPRTIRVQLGRFSTRSTKMAKRIRHTSYIIQTNKLLKTRVEDHEGACRLLQDEVHLRLDTPQDNTRSHTVQHVQRNECVCFHNDCRHRRKQQHIICMVDLGYIILSRVITLIVISIHTTKAQETRGKHQTIKQEVSYMNIDWRPTGIHATRGPLAQEQAILGEYTWTPSCSHRSHMHTPPAPWARTCTCHWCRDS